MCLAAATPVIAGAASSGVALAVGLLKLRTRRRRRSPPAPPAPPPGG